MRRAGANADRLAREVPMRFQNQVALITAAASGIGRATAGIMAREGATVFGVDSNAERLQLLEREIKQAGGRVSGIQADATNPDAARMAVERVKCECGRIDILVNGVGGSTIIAKPAAHVDELSFAEWQKLIAFNLDATFLFCHEVVPIMKQLRRGKIVNISSIAGRGRNAPSSAAYAAAKGGINSFTKKLAAEVGPFGITVNAIAPCLTITERMKPHWEARSEQSREALISQIPLRRVPVAEDQAKVVCFLSSSDADFVTGLSINVTGGL
jgi:NAD(P)-dependent dehydrogenase (short-subunit alcohol dehydrogenase family)